MGIPSSTIEISEFGQQNGLIRYFTRHRIANWLVLTLSLSFLLSGVNLAAAATTITKSITVKTANGSAYQGAQVQIFATNPGEETENLGPIQTTPSNGVVSISYKSNAYIAYLIITPAVTDTTHAVAVIDLLKPSNSAIAGVTLKAATFFLNPQMPDGSAVPVGTQVNLTANLADRYGQLPYRVARAGAFGVVIPINSVIDLDYGFSISANMPETANMYGTEFSYRKNSNGSVTLSNPATSAELTQSSGAYIIKLQQSKLRGALKKGNGTAYTLSTDQALVGSLKPILASGDYDSSREQGDSQFNESGEFAFTESLSAGKYLVSFYDKGSSANPLPAFDAGFLYVDAQGKFSTTENGTYSTTLDLSYTVPTTGLTTFKILDTNGNSIGISTGFYAFRADTTYGKYFYFDQRQDANGISSARFANGKYILVAHAGTNREISKSLELTVTDSGTSLKDYSNNSVINKVGENYELRIGQANFQFKVLSPVDHSTPLSDAFAIITKGSKAKGDTQTVGKYRISPDTPVAKTYLADGTYILTIASNWNETNSFIDQDYVVVKSGETTTVTKGSSTISAVNGVYTLEPGLAQISGRVLGSNGTSLIRDATVYLSSPSAAAGLYLAEANTNTDGGYKFDLPDNFVDGTYRLQAQGQPNIGQGKSDYVSITVTNGFATTTPDIQLRVPNVTGTLSGPLGVSPLNKLFLAKEISSNVYDFENQMAIMVDENGQYSTFLDEGKYQITSNSDLQFAGGVKGPGSICTVPATGSSAATAIICDVTLSVPNVTGTVKVNNVIATEISVMLQPATEISGNTANDSYDWIGQVNGVFGFKANPGTYRMFLNGSINGQWGAQPVGLCVVPTGGTVVCDVNLPAANLKLKVNDSDGTALTADNYLGIGIKTANGFADMCCSYPRTNPTDGLFNLSLIDGVYQIWAGSWSNSTKGLETYYTFEVVNGVVSKMLRKDDTSETTITGDTYTLTLRGSAITGIVYKPDSTTPVSNIQVCATEGENEKSNTYCATSDSNGIYKIQSPYSEKSTIWRVYAQGSREDFNLGKSASATVTVLKGVGDKAANLVLRATNLIGTVSGANGASPNNYVYARKVAENGGDVWLDNSYAFTNTVGKFGFFLEPGRYRFFAQADMTVAGGVANSSDICIVTSDSATAVICNISLPAPNVNGTVNFSGLTGGGFIQFSSENQSSYYGTANIASNGSFYNFLAPGLYRLQVYSYKSQSYIIGPTCLIPTSGTVTCDIELPNENLSIRVNDASGALMKEGVQFYLQLQLPSGQVGANANPTSDTATGVRKLRLANGTYRLNVSPNYDKRSSGSTQVYELVVTGGSVSTLKLEGANSTLTASDGIYTLNLAAASAAGNVVAPDGSTPVSNSLVYLYGEKLSSNDWTNASGYFAFAKLPDGTYSIVAYPAYGDATKGQSMPTSVTVTNSVGSNDLKLTLRAPNVTGVVRGPNGVAKGVWLTVEKLEAEINWTYVQRSMSVQSSPEGNFAYTLDPGTYRFRTSGDTDSSGGAPTVSDNCVVPASGVVTCNITLTAPNFGIKVVAPGQTTWNQNSGAWAYFFDKAGNSTVKNNYPNFSWSKNGDLQTYLENGTWKVIASAGNSALLSDETFEVIVANNVVTSVISSGGQTVTKTGSTYLLPLNLTNLTGEITFKGTRFNGSGIVSVQRLENDYYYSIAGRWVDNGLFGFKVEPGTYRIEARPYYSQNNEEAAIGYSADCVVTLSSSVTCNVALNTPNLKGFVANELGQPYSYSYAYLNLISGDNKYTNQSINVNEGRFTTFIKDGTYQLVVAPYYDKRASYTERSYRVVVASGVVTGAFDFLTGDTVTAVSGVYPFKLGVPSVKGKVVAPGTGGLPMANIQVLLGPVGGSADYWTFGTTTDSTGNFALTVPDGTYRLQAVPTGGRFLYGKSAAIVIAITNGAVTAAPTGYNFALLTLALREPNLTGRVVTPGVNPQPLANVNVNIYVDGEYFYGWTNSDGRFAVFVENATPNCVNGKGCSINLNYYKSADYTPKQYAITGIGNRGDLAIGGVTAKLTVLLPQASGPALPSAYSWISVEKVESNGSTSWVTSGNTNENGVVGLSLDEGVNYRIWAYPNGEKSGQFSPAKLTVNSFAAASMSALSLTFATPNLYLTVKGSDNTQNRWAWFNLSNWDSATAVASGISGGYLDDQGKGALTLENGMYQLLIWPGKSNGVTKTIIITVTGGVARVTSGTTGSDVIADGNVTLKLAAGNISGTVKNANGSNVLSAVVAAYETGTNKIVNTATDANGYYELNLDLTSSWTIKAIDPETSYLGSISVASRSPSNTVVSQQNISLAASS